MQPWPVVLFGQLPRQRRSACELAPGKDNGAVRIQNVFLCALRVAGCWHLIQVVFVRQDAVLSLPTLRYPTAMGDIVLNGYVKGRLIGAGLAAGYDFGDHGIRLILLKTIAGMGEAPPGYSIPNPFLRRSTVCSHFGVRGRATEF
jgi:hypothetical protein